MQYILTEQEYKELLYAKEYTTTLSKNKLQTLCTKIANEMPVKWGWNGPDPKPWGCVISQKEEWYCDKCPVQTICPYDHKEYSK